MCVKKKKKDINRGKFPCEKARVCINKKIFKHYRTFSSYPFSHPNEIAKSFSFPSSYRYSFSVCRIVGTVFVMLLIVSRDNHFSQTIKGHQKKKNRESFRRKNIPHAYWKTRI